MILSAALVSLKANAQCATPTNLASSYSNNVSSFTWDAVPSATEYYFEIDWAGGGWSFGSMPVTNNHFELTGLMQGGNFQWRVTANCGTLSAPSATVLFNTPCMLPVNLTTTNITTNAAKLNWQVTPENPNNTGFSVSYRRANVNAGWTQLTNIYNNPTAQFFNLSGLSAGTAYEWRVRRVCSFSCSDYVYSSFVTLSCISNGVNTREWIDLFALGSINRTSGAEPGGYANVEASTDLVIGSNNNAGQISAGYSGNFSNQKYSVYIDFNKNGSFADAGERLINSVTINNAGIKTFSINIPSNISAGQTRMRVIMQRSSSISSPCITGYNGETEDYNVNLINANRSLISEQKNPPAVMNTKNPFLALMKTEPALPDDGIHVGPNPSTGNFNVSFDGEFTPVRYKVVNINGVYVQQGKMVFNKQYQIDITELPAGIYMLQLTDQNNLTKSAKLIKNQ